MARLALMPAKPSTNRGQGVKASPLGPGPIHRGGREEGGRGGSSSQRAFGCTAKQPRPVGRISIHPTR